MVIVDFPGDVVLLSSLFECDFIVFIIVLSVGAGFVRFAHFIFDACERFLFVCNVHCVLGVKNNEGNLVSEYGRVGSERWKRKDTGLEEEFLVYFL